MKIIKDGTITNVKGIKAAGISAQLKKSGKKDLALIYSEKKAVSAAVFTKNLVKAAPIILNMENIKNGNTQAIIVNSGNANSCTGETGLENAKKMTEFAANELGLKKEEILVQSTGIIGVQLDMEKIETGISKICKEISKDGGNDAAEAIMTTDTFTKQICVEIEIDGKTVTVAGMAKGSGMIHPNMATMLAFTVTDVNIEKSLLQKIFSEITDSTFNMISVDRDTSTNDMACVIANGQKVAKSVITSSLFKAAVFGEDPNWGRILCAVGYSEAELIVDKVNIFLGNDINALQKGVQVAKNGIGIEFDNEKAVKILKNEKVEILIELNDGEFSSTAWGCDLSYDYVKINAEYHT